MLPYLLRQWRVILNVLHIMWDCKITGIGWEKPAIKDEETYHIMS